MFLVRTETKRPRRKGGRGRSLPQVPSAADGSRPLAPRAGGLRRRRSDCQRRSVAIVPARPRAASDAATSAAAAGRACVTSDVPGCRDAIIPGETGILFPARNGKAMAEAIRPLIASRQLQASMGLAARAHAEAYFAIAEVVRQNLAIYHELVSPSGLRSS